MDFFRRHMKAIFIITIGGFVVSIFAGFGGYYLSKKYNMVAKVNSKRISKQKYWQQVNQALKMKKDDEEVNEEQIKIEVMRNLIQEQIYLQEAKKLKVDVSQNEVINVLRTYPIFQTEGNFDHRKYFKTVRFGFGLSPQEFEANIKNEIVKSKLNILMTESIKTSEQEIKDAYKFKNNNSLKGYEEKKESFQQEFLSQKKMALLNSWFRTIAMNSKIQTFLDKQ